MKNGIRFAHVNLVSDDWRRLAGFYADVFGCAPVPPERDLAGDWLDRAVGIENAAVRGIHLRLPGCGDGGPTLEIFRYDRHGGEHLPPAANRPGIGHIAFAVDDVETVCEEILAAGGQAVGEIVTAAVPGAGTITFAYMADPDGNIVEVQRWERD